MTTIHDEEKMKEIASRIALNMDGRTVTSHEHYREMLTKEISYEIKLYAEYIHLKTIDECIGCVQKLIINDTKSCPFPTAEGSAAREIITNLKQLNK